MAGRQDKHKAEDAPEDDRVQKPRDVVTGHGRSVTEHLVDGPDEDYDEDEGGDR